MVDSSSWLRRCGDNANNLISINIGYVMHEAGPAGEFTGLSCFEKLMLGEKTTVT